MLKNDTASDDQGEPAANLQVYSRRAVEIPQALPMRLQTLDLARHSVKDPRGKRYVVATYDDARLGRGFVTAVYPQQNEYLTLVRLTIVEYFSSGVEEAIERHVATAEAIKKGKLAGLEKRSV
jgi:hypothetical protein